MVRMDFKDSHVCYGEEDDPEGSLGSTGKGQQNICDKYTYVTSSS